MMATPFTSRSRTDLSTIQVNLTVSEEAKKDLLEGGDKLFNVVEEKVWPDGQFAGSIIAAARKPQVRRGSWIVADPGSGFIVVLFVIVTNQFVAKGLPNWVGTSKDLKEVIEGDKKVGVVLRRFNMKFCFRIFAVGRNIRKVSECY